MLIEITTHPVSSIIVMALENITLHCSASVDDVTYSWHRTDGVLPSNSRGRHSDTLSLIRTTPHDEGVYYCIARKLEIIVKSDNASIKVDGMKL